MILATRNATTRDTTIGTDVRTEAEPALRSRWVAPRELVGAGFTFDHAAPGPALDDILSPDRVAAVEPSRAD